MSQSLKNQPILKKLIQNSLIAGSLVMFIGSMIASSGSYLYHLLLGRMLGPINYGELESIISILYLLTIIINTLILVVSKFVANLKGRDDLAGVGFLSYFLTRRLLVLGGILSLSLIALSPLIVSFLHLDTIVPIIFASLAFFLGLILGLNRGILQGLLKFKEVTVSNICEHGLKVPIAVLLVVLGFKVSGAVFAIFLAGLIAYFLTLFYLRSIKKIPCRKPEFLGKSLIKFAFPVFLFNLSFTSLFTTDIILVKHFFSPYEAGLYAALAVLGKIIFFASNPITMVMFPMVVNHQSRGKSYYNLLRTSFLLTLLICLGIVFIYFFFPKLMVFLLFGKEYLGIVSLVGWIAIFISFYSLAYLLVNFFLSVERTKLVILPALAAMAQVVFISLFHHTLLQVIQVSIFVSGLLLLGLMIYYFYGQTQASLSHRSRL